jgi:hypothetical protein
MSYKSEESYVNSPDCRKPAKATFVAIMKLTLLMDSGELVWCNVGAWTSFSSTSFVTGDACFLRRFGWWRLIPLTI